MNLVRVPRRVLIEFYNPIYFQRAHSSFLTQNLLNGLNSEPLFSSNDKTIEMARGFAVVSRASRIEAHLQAVRC